jgi:hypothetical protein
MSDTTHPAARKVAQHLDIAELQHDASIIAAAELMISVVQGRKDAALPFGALQGAMADAGEAISLSVRSRHHLARAHQRLLEAATEHELLPRAHGDIFPCFTSAELNAPEEPRLRSVG